MAVTDKPPSPRKNPLKSLLSSLLFAGITAGAFWQLLDMGGGSFPGEPPAWRWSSPAPLVMKGGDPYIRALLRTISASESNDPRPYSLIYGGSRFRDFQQHPDRCITIEQGPNQGDCSTAAGRYQFITTTWTTEAERYHPHPNGLLLWRRYNFSPEAQDMVTHRWLNDPEAWGADLGAMLREGRVTEVLSILSPTWTSLGYGIETNSMSSSLPQIYEEMLADELKQAATPEETGTPTGSPTGTSGQTPIAIESPEGEYKPNTPEPLAKPPLQGIAKPSVQNSATQEPEN
jgi:muramidase (phage lysozyme)